jgi:pimeloyl-ACP methyl ester carboxylesterase
MRQLAWSLAFLALLGSACATPQIAPTPAPAAADREGQQTTTHIYATKDGQDLRLDLIVDDTVEVAGKRPVILFSYGGGWEGGARDDKGFVAGLTHFTSAGYAVIAIDYRLGIKIAKTRGEFTPETGVAMYLRAIEWSVEDIFDATALALRNADDWNIDPKRIVLVGGSAGATNSLVAEYNVANETDLARSRLPAGFRYAGVVSMAGAFWLKADTPLVFKHKPAPIMFFHGAKDQLVTYDEVQGPFSGYGPVAYARKFAGPDYPKWFVDYPQGDHIIAGMPMIDALNEIDAFLARLVDGREQVSIHTVEEGAVPKTIENVAKLVPQGGG